MFEPPPTPAGTPTSVRDWAVPGVPVPRAEVVSPAQQAARVVVAALAARDVAGMSDQEVLDHTTFVLELTEQLRLVGVAGLAQVHARRLHELDGAGTTAKWVGAKGLTADAKELAVAKRLGAFPTVAGRVLAGALPLPAAHALQTTLAKLRPHLDRPDGLIDGQPAQDVLQAVLVDGVRMLVAESRGGFPTEDDPVLARLLTDLPEIAGRPVAQLDRVESALVLLAELVEPGQLSGCLGLLVDALLPQQLEDAARRGHDRRFLRLVKDADGTGWSLRATLDLEAGERLHLLLQAELSRDPDGPLDTETAAQLREQGVAPYSDEVAPTLAPRGRAERLHDALNRGLARYLSAGLGGMRDKNPVQVLVSVPVATMNSQPAPLPARTSSGTVVPASLVQQWVCDSAITRHVMDLRGRVLATSHTGRTLNRAERRALQHQTGGHCQGAGCRRSTADPGTILHPHHADPWSRCRTTSLTDTVLLCESCHRHVHHGHVLRLKDGRRLGPDGWVGRPEHVGPPDGPRG